MESLTGSAQRDTINGVGNVNHITGGGGADTLNGGNIIDYFYFAAGSDVVAGEVINGGAGSNELIIQNAGTYNFSLATLSNIDSVGIGSGVIAIFDGAQIGTGVVDTVYSSSAGVDTLIVNGPNIDLTGVLFAFWDAGDIINLNGTAAADTIVGSDEDDTIFGSGGADTLVGDQGNDIFRYVDFSDVVAGESIAGDDGTDVLRVEDFCDFSFATITGVEGLTFAPATATGNATAVFSGSQIGTSGITAIAGGGNRNRIVVTGPSVDLTELTFTNWTSGPPSTPGVDDITINGTSGADTLTGSSERDTFSISSGADALDGGGGDDQFLFFASPDAGTTVTGDDGLDTIVLQGFPSTFDITQASLESIERLHINTTAETILTGLQIGSVGITTVIGSGITGPGGSSVLDRLVVRGDFIDLTPVVFQVWQADDQITLLGTAGADTLFGSSQNDRIDGGTGGADTMGGAGGDDTYIVDNINDQVIEAFVQGTNDRVQTSTTYALAAGSEVEVLETNDANGTVLMDLVGNELGNTIVGNAATNVLVGGRGVDTLIGGGGADIYVWTAMNEMGAVVGSATDTVGPEFNANIGDRIAVNAIDVDGDGNTAEQEFTFLGEAATNPFTAPGQISWFNNVPGNETFILLNTDADAEHDGVIRVLGVHTVDANWFQL
jgi:Ca2+-binding RTX toxin-like protein